jgi:hypothetical protein
MIISKGWETKWLYTTGTGKNKKDVVIELKDMTDKHLLSVLFHVYKLVKEAGTAQPHKEPYAENTPDFVKLGYKQEWMNIAPPFYWNCVAECKRRGLYA